MGGKRVDIQWLRAIAATEVVICHSDLVTKHFSDFELQTAWWYAPFGGIGVELFFILSGYVICMKAPGYGTATAFLISRVRRLFPMYAVFTSLVLLTFLINPAWRLNNFELNAVTVVSSYLILPQWPVPILGVGWTLEHEMAFYWVIALVMAVMTMNAGNKPLAGWLLAAIGFFGCLQGPPPGISLWAHHIVSPYMLAFAAGWLLRCEEEAEQSPPWSNAAFFAGVLALAYAFGGDYGDELVIRIALMTVLFVAVVACRRIFEADNHINRLGGTLGDASFSIYLCHWFVLSVLGKILGILQPHALSGELVRLFGIAASLAAGVWIFKYVEKPIDLWLRKGTPLNDLLRPRLSIRHDDISG